MSDDATDQTSVKAETPAPKWREVYLLSGMRGLSFAGDIVAETAIVLLLHSRGAGAYAITAVLLAATIPPVILAPITGRIADSFDSRKLIVSVALLQALVCIGMTLWTSPIALIGLSALLSAGLAFTHPVFAALPRPMVGKENVPRASSISQSTAMAGMIAAPGIGGVLVGHFGLTIPLLIDAVSFVFIAIGGLIITTRLHANRGTTAKGGDEKEKAPQFRVWSNPYLRSLLVLSGVVMLCASIINVLIVFYVRDTFDGSTSDFGLVMSTWMAGLVPGGLLARRLKRLSFEAILIGTFLCIGVAILGVGLAPGLWWILPFYFLGGIGNGAQASVTHILVNTRVPDGHQGRAFAALGAVSNSGPALGFVLGGVFLSFMSPRTGFLISGALVMAGILVFSRDLLKSGGSTIDESKPDDTQADLTAEAKTDLPASAESKG